MSERYDVVIVGSGFGGSVAALRLVEKGYRVLVLEAGRRFADHELPKTSWDVRRFLWAPALGFYGIQRISLLKDVLVLSGAGVGGGSLVYANTLYEPPDEFYADPQWAAITDWRAELAPHYDQAKRMLGVVRNPTVTASDDAMRAVARRMGVEHTFTLTPVGVHFGEPGVERGDPYFGGAGPARRGCIQCGACMTGCRHNAKNTLVKNYLHLAEHAGAEVRPLTTVTRVRPHGTGYEIRTRRTGRPARATIVADQVIFAAGALGTQRLLHAARDRGDLRELSGKLGFQTRTNSESLLGASTRRVTRDFSRGVAITSSFHPAPDTHVEPVRYGRGSNLMGLLQTVLVPGDSAVPRVLAWLGLLARHPGRAARTLSLRRWSERTVIALVMQTVDNSLVVSRRRGRLTTRQGDGAANPSWLPVGHEAVRLLAEEIGGEPGGNLGEVANMPMTAHILGGCPIGARPEAGVLDAYQRVYGHPGLHVVDGAAVSANLGVNPSLTITAQAERAMSFWPNRGEPDTRPPLGTPYRPTARVAPNSPAVPAQAPAALR